jgi:hypothetical protein
MSHGECLCGALVYEVEGAFENIWHCHCSMCRKAHGAPFASGVAAPASRFRWVRGEETVREYESSPGRVRRFCATCAAVAPTPRGDLVLLAAGNLGGDLGLPPGLHIFTASKAPWHVIAGDAPQHAGAPPGWGIVEVERPAPRSLEGASGGSCLCGGVTFSVTGAPARWMQCHCSRCRRGRSAAHGSNMFYPAAQFAWHTGRDRVRMYRPPDAERFTVSFCADCGGGAPVERENVPVVLVPAALFDDDPGGRPEAHIHVASKAPWYRIADDMPQFAELPPA